MTLTRSYEAEFAPGFAEVNENGLTMRYDPQCKRYTGQWDKNANGIKGEPLGSLEGGYDEETRTLTMYYYEPDFKAGQEHIIEEHITKFVDADRKVYSVSCLQPSGDGRFFAFTLYALTAKRRTP